MFLVRTPDNHSKLRQERNGCSVAPKRAIELGRLTLVYKHFVSPGLQTATKIKVGK